jgi:hypothetical protein
MQLFVHPLNTNTHMVLTAANLIPLFQFFILVLLLLYPLCRFRLISTRSWWNAW